MKRLFLFLLLGFFQYYYSQDKAEKALHTFNEKYPQEKIHLLFDKSSYIVGENLWFKAFVFEGYNRSNISTSIFVELYDANKTLVSKKLFPLLNGEGSGSILLPETLKEDIYYIRAYTTWMSNFSEDFQLVRPITVYNPSSPDKLIKDTISSWTASVHPESGTFINGINTKFAVRLHSKGTTPSDWNGYIIDSTKPDIHLADFKGFDQNVGLFSITPENGKKYQLTISDKNGNKQNIDLPEVTATGINLQVTSNKDAIKYTLKTNNSSANSQYFKILGTINNQLVYKAKINKISNETSYSIPTNKLINGILQLTVFDDKENVVVQRLCFVQADLLNIKQPSLKSSLNTSPRGKNSFEIAKDPNYTNYSVVVMDANTHSPEEENSLLSTLWLTGDIPSKIYMPSQYFTKNRNIEALDALLISEKWKRFNWVNLILDRFPIINRTPESYISYKGKVVIQSKPASNTDLNLIFTTPNYGTKFYPVKTDANGFFTFGNLVFEDSMKFSYQLNDEKVPKETVQVFFQPNFEFVPYKSSLPISEFSLKKRLPDDQLPIEISRLITTKSNQKIINEKVTDIEEVTIKGAKKVKTQKLNEQLSSSLFKSMNEQVFDFVNENQHAQYSSGILQWLQGQVAGLEIQSQGGNYIAYMRGGKVDLYLDEMKIDAGQASSISMSDIAMVKVIKGSFAGGFGGGGNGAIAIYSRRGGITGSISNSTIPSSLKQITLNGYSKETPFNNPRYDNTNFKSISYDIRSVLYWNPYLETLPNTSSIIQFFNNDDAKAYKVIVIAFDDNETPLYYNETLK
ncbi:MULTISPECIES: hypothetical protein [Chryseobacterium]|uniref:TonB-dependent receptor-like protein n=1 Tax=Chryseobacterium geocarposphaerae TaxID=1416776 RepID=A0ABU1LG55_9FLAO|nr:MULTISPECIES: hypothetical protein [Chryseobacterium]MDR6405708.1 hypothetical protein [Chryseobacterium geocarposphaerae]MDR6699130.1 hypothetical protein [Chryseobacterium ginsenosidimutans]